MTAKGKEISCGLWKRGRVLEKYAPNTGAPIIETVPRVECSFFDDGKCSHRMGPLHCSTGGLRSIVREGR